MIAQTTSRVSAKSDVKSWWVMGSGYATLRLGINVKC
jgi:hypothetical protein